jgi:hypothetical protein
MAIAMAADLCASHAVVNGAGQAKASVNLALELADVAITPDGPDANARAVPGECEQHELAAEQPRCRCRRRSDAAC